MKTISITTTYNIKCGIKDHPDYVITECGKVINIKKGIVIKNVYPGGYYLNGKFISRLLEMPLNNDCPF